MRVLCVHGKGSNVSAMKSGVAPLQREMRRIMGHDAESEFIHLQGLMETNAIPGFDKFFSPPFYQFWDADSPSSVLAAVERIASSISTNKADVIFAHSEGGAAALSALLHRPNNVKCLVLVSPFPPYDASGSKRLDVSLCGTPINIPTLFVRGESDPLRHFVALTEGLVNKRKLIGYSWKGGHEIPNSGERGMWVGITQKLVELLEEAQP